MAELKEDVDVTAEEMATTEMEPEDAEHQPQKEETADDKDGDRDGDGDEDEDDNGPKKKLTKREKKKAKKQQKAHDRTAALNVKKELSAAATSTADGNIPESLRPFVERVDANRVLIRRGFSKDMRVDALCFVNSALLPQMLEEFAHNTGFLPALKQMANVASIPGIVKYSFGMPDAHSGYGFSIGGVAAVDMSDPKAVVCPGGVGFDINCGVCLLRTNLTEADLTPQVRQRLADELFARIPVGVGSKGGLGLTREDFDSVLRNGLGFLVEQGLATADDMESCEEGGCIKSADPDKVSKRAKARGLSQVGTLGSGNHYAEVQVVDEVFDQAAASAMGLNQLGRVCVMIHSGSRGLGHQICTDALQEMQRVGLENPNDKQLTGVPVNSVAGKNYLAAMACGANFAFCNRGMMRDATRRAFQTVFNSTPEKLDMKLVYDVCHNIAKIEDHIVDGKPMRVLVHRKGATRAFAPGHPLVPEKYRAVGQPVIIGGSMGTSSYVLTGTQIGMDTTFGSTCHGAGRSLSRGAALRGMTANEVMQDLRSKNVILKIATPKLVAEEASDAYKDVSQVVQTCHDAGISKLCVRMRPVIVCKG